MGSNALGLYIERRKYTFIISKRLEFLKMLTSKRELPISEDRTESWQVLEAVG
jgi:hypothetical protein